MGPSAQTLVGAIVTMLYGARLSRNPMIINGRERSTVVLGPAILEYRMSYDGWQLSMLS